MHRRVALAGEKKQQVMDSHVISMQSLDPRDTDQYLMEQERIIRKTRVALNPLMRMPLMATSSVTDCARLFEVMQQARANLVVYMMAPSRDMVTATLIAFPNLKKLIPALADEELQLAA